MRNEDAALDIIQDSMLRLAEKYGGKPAPELPLLFQRILQNAIRDWYRRQKVRSMWTTLLSSLGSDREQAESDPLDTLIVESNIRTPHDEVERRQILDLIEHEVQRLPLRQRQAFLLRYWEELDVAQTAASMGCSAGSVKTHCSRATHALAAALKAKGIQL